MATGQALAANAQVLRLGAGLSVVRVKAFAAAARASGGMALPAAHVSTPIASRSPQAEILGPGGEVWLDGSGGEVFVRCRPGGGAVVVTAYGLPADATAIDLEILALDDSLEARPPVPPQPVADGRQTANFAATEDGELRLGLAEPILVGGRVAIEVRGSLEIIGAAVANKGIAAIEVLVDGRHIETAVYRPNFPEQPRLFSKPGVIVTCDFAMRVPGSALGAGEHAVQVRMRDKPGREAAVAFTVAAEGMADTGPWALRRKMPQAEIDLGMRILAGLRRRPRFALLLAVPADADGIERARATLASLRTQAYPDWRLTVFGCSPGRLRERLMPEFAELPSPAVVLPEGCCLDLADPAILCDAGGAELLSLLRAGDALGCDALLEMAIAAGLAPEADFFYSDERRLDPVSGTVQPYYKPEWSPDLLLSTNYIGRLWAARPDLLRRTGASLADLARFGDYDLVLRLSEAAASIRHVPKLLCEQATAGDDPASDKRALRRALARRGIAGTVLPGCAAGIYRVKRAVTTPGLVSIIIPTRAGRGLIKTCIESLRRTTANRNYEILCIDNIPAAATGWKRWLRDSADVVIDVPETFNWARFNNLAAARARGEFLLFLNDDIKIVEPGWLDALLEHGQRPEVGVVGPLLLYPGGTVQHAGVFLSRARLWGEHAFRHADARAPGPFGTMLTMRNVIAVTGACMLVRRGDFERAGGFDERHRVINNDLDYCLRSWRDGKLTVFTPYARLIHHESVTLKGESLDHDAEAFERQWRDLFLQGDPYYSPWLTRALNRSDYRPDDEPTRLVHAGWPLLAPEQIRRILVCKLDLIGNLVTAFPALRRLKRLFPQARLVLLAAPSAAALTRLEPGIDEVIEFAFFHEQSGLGARSVPAAELQALEQKLRGHRFDLAIDLRVHSDTRRVLQLSGATWLAGFDRGRQFSWLDIAVEWEGAEPLAAKRRHISEHLMRLVDAIAVNCDPDRAVIGNAVLSETLAELPRLPAEMLSRPVVCIHPGAGTETKRWPPEQFAELIDLLLGHAVNIVIVGGADDDATAAAILDRVRDDRRVFSLAGRLPLADLPRLLSRCALFVGNDSGPKHIAAGLGVPTVGIHSGMVDPVEWGPLGPNAVAIGRDMSCAPCYLATAAQCRRGLACLKGLGAGEVYEVCRRLLAIGITTSRPGDWEPTPARFADDAAPRPKYPAPALLSER